MKERKERIEKLLERYFEARTTDAEEQELKAYFREGETDPGLRYARAMFCGMDGLAGECLPEPVQAFGHRPGGSEVPAPVRDRGSGRRGARLFLCVEYMRRPYCYIDGQAVYDKDVAMRTTVYLQGFSEFADPEHLVEELIVND